MQKSFKRILGILICTVLSALSISSASASSELSSGHKTLLNQLYTQYTETDSRCLYDWRKEVLKCLNNIDQSSPVNQSLAGKAFLYLASKITGNKLLKHAEVFSYTITRVFAGDKIESLKCCVTTTYSRTFIVTI